MALTNKDRFEDTKKKRGWISDRLIQYVDIVFGLVVGQSIIRYIDIIRYPKGNPFVFTALCVVIITIALSWIGYHKSMYNYPYKSEGLRVSRIRPFTDFIIVILYTILLITIEDLQIYTDSAKINITFFTWIYVLIYLFYIIDGSLRMIEYRDRKASKFKLLFSFYAIHVIIWVAYMNTFGSSRQNEVNYIALFLCLCSTIIFRILRTGGYEVDKPLTLLVDVDGVLADQVTPVLDHINALFKSNYTKQDIHAWDQALPLADTNIKDEIENSHRRPLFVMKMTPIPGASKVLRELSKFCTITIATNRIRLANIATKMWLLMNNIPYDHYINTSKKGKGAAEGEILIDDYPKNITDFLARDGKERMAFIFTQPWNEGDSSMENNKKIIRIHSWQEIKDRIEKLAYMP